MKPRSMKNWTPAVTTLFVGLAFVVGIATATAGEVVPAVNGIRDDDGVIRFRPPNCGPEGYVIHDPKLGKLCAQKGSWKVATKDSKEGKFGTPCLRSKDDLATGEKGELFECQRLQWRKASAHQIGDACKDIEITVNQGGTILLCNKGKYRAAPEKASVASFAMLPPKGNVTGDVRKVQTTFGRFVWNGDEWVWMN